MEKRAHPDNSDLQDPLLSHTSNPYDDSSFIGRLFFLWINPLLAKGQTTYLQKEMLYPVPKALDAQVLLKKFKTHWPKVKNKTAPILRMILRANRKEVLIFLLVCFLNSIFTFVNPIIINRVIDFAENPDKDLTSIIVFLIVIFFGKFFALIFSTLSDFLGNMLGASMTGTLSIAIYEKCLKYSLSRSKNYNEGKLVNLMQTDLEVISFLFERIYAVIFLPLQIIAGLLIMFYYVGIAFLAGVGVIVLMGILNYLIGKVYIKFQDQLMDAKDARSKASSEMLNGIKHIKMNAEEYSAYNKLTLCRKKELKILMKQRGLDVSYVLIFWITPMLVTTLTFVVFIIMNNEITALKAFTVIALFQTLSGPLVNFPYSIADLINCGISFARIGEFLLESEIDEKTIKSNPEDAENHIVIKNGTFYWEKSNGSSDDNKNDGPETKSPSKASKNNHIIDAKLNNDSDSILNKTIPESLIRPEATLRCLDMEIQRGSFVAVVGIIGSGKTSIFHAILNEMKWEEEKFASNPSVTINGSIAYASQKPWIQNLTIRENIIFGLPFEAERYALVKNLSSLDEDLKLFKHGDETMIGDKGINLSGGQKARLSLARALYADKEIYLFDDILAAVDAHVGRSIFKECFLKHLKNKTRVLITHALYYLKHVDYIFVIDNGIIVEKGTFQQLKNSTVLEEVLKKFEEDKNFAENQTSNEDNEELEDPSNHNNAPSFIHGDFDREMKNPASEQNFSIAFYPNNPNVFQNKPEDQAAIKKLIDIKEEISQENPENTSLTVKIQDQYSTILDDLIMEEDREVGQVKWGVIKNYISYNGGVFFWSVIFLLMLIWVCLQLGSNLWLKFWVDSNDNENNAFYVKVYALFALTYAFCCAGRATMLFIGSYFCSLKVHNNIIQALLMAPLNEFFDRVPLGRLLNRLSKDLYTVDVQVSFTIGTTLVVFYSLLMEFGMCFYAVKYWVLIPVVVMMAFMLKVQSIYLKCNREIVRLEAISKSPIVSFFTETLGGLSIIRAFSHSQRFLDKHAEYLNDNIRTLVIRYGFEEWFTQRIAFLSFILLMSITALSLFWNFEPSLIGLLLYYLFDLEMDLRYMISLTSSLECHLISFERCNSLAKIVSEAGYILKEIQNKEVFSGDKDELKFWPKEGKIEFLGVDIRYRANLDLVLKNLTLTVNPNEKIGIVGRTGAGKSTIILSLLRILETSQGSILIDGIDIKTLDLRDLRRKITVIPQDVYLFEGSLRENLDPNNEYSDENIWKSLDNVNLKETFEKRNGLLSEIKEQGINLSAGEKQLLALSKAFLRNNRIILIDEATANIDLATEKKIQEVIKEKFKEYTVLTIAHRLNTILHNDRILVLEKGRVEEFDSPEKLLQNKQSRFYGLWEESLAGIVY